MSRWGLPLVVVGFAALALPGCMHRDQDAVAIAAAQDLAMIPRDLHTQAVLNTPKPKPAFKETLPGKGQPEVLKLPPELPGADAPLIGLPPRDPAKAKDPQRDEAIQALFPTLPALGDELKPSAGPGGQPLDLPALQRIALSNNPTVQQAAASVQAACGAAAQAGYYPNPSLGLQWDSIGQAETIGQPGIFFEQSIITANKLELARAAAMMDVRNAQLALRRTQLDVMTQVRSAYFAVLVARENLVVSRALATLTEDTYRLQVKIVEAGQAAAYEPLQLQAFAVQARGAVMQARNRYMSAWRQLAAALGQPELPPTEVAGRAEAIPPRFDYETLRAHVLGNHTDRTTAGNGITKARILLELARVASVPDINTQTYVQKDHTAEPNRFQAGVQIGVAVPVWHANQGAILQAQAQLAKAHREIGRVENDLTQRIADAFERYRNNLQLADFNRQNILPNHVQVYRAIYQRYTLGLVQYNDIVVAQQALAQALQNYMQILSAQWQACAELAALGQTDDMYELTMASNQPQHSPAPIAQLLDSRSWTTAAGGTPWATTQPTTRATLATPTIVQTSGQK